MIAAIDKLSVQMRQREQQAQSSFDQALRDIFRKVAFIALVFLAVIVHRRRDHRAEHPLAVAGTDDRDGRASRRAITTARFKAPRPPTKSAKWRARSRCSATTPSPSARPRTSCAPQGNAENALGRTARGAAEPDRCGTAGRARRHWCAGVAHEVNNPDRHQPDGAHPASRGAARFSAEVKSERAASGASRLEEFIDGGRDAANQLVGNLQRAGRTDPVVQAGRGRPPPRGPASVRPAGGDRADRRQPAPGAEESRSRSVVEVAQASVMDSLSGAYRPGAAPTSS